MTPSIKMKLMRRPAKTAAAAVVASLLSVFLPAAPLPPAGALPQAVKVGVVDFYALSPLGSYSGVIPERLAADQLSALLERSGGGRFDVISRAAMQEAEATMRWQSADVLSFARLQALGRAVGADRLMVGWITQLAVQSGGGGVNRSSADGGGDGPPSAFASIVLQVFDEAQGRLIASTKQSAEVSYGSTRALLAARALQVVLERAFPDIVSKLGD